LNLLAVSPASADSFSSAAPPAAAPARPLDRVETLLLLALAGLSMAVLAALLTKGRPLSGADGLLASDQLQYLTWIREASEHGLIGNRFDLAPGDRVFLHPLFFLSGLVVQLGASIPVAYLALWKPVAVVTLFAGVLVYVRRMLPPGGQRWTALVLGLFAVMPASWLVAWSGWGGNPRQYTFDFISGEMWAGGHLWGYLPTAIAVGLLPIALLLVERRRWLPAAATGLLVCWLQPWQGAELGLILAAATVVRARSVRPLFAPGFLLVAAAIAAPAVYYLALSTFDPSWELAGQANARGAQETWRWPWWAMALTVAPLAVPAALAYRLPATSWQDVAVRAWPFAVLLVFLLPFGTFPYHAFQGLTIPLAVLAVQGVTSVWPRPRPALVIGALVLMTLPGIAHKLDIARTSVQAGGDPYWIFPDEQRALRLLEEDPRPGGVLAPTYAGYMIPYTTGRESYVGQFSWTPDWNTRQRLVNDLFEGRLTGEAARRFVVSTDARFLFSDCRPLADITATVRPLLAAPPRRFGCATVYELRFRPEMARAAGPPDA